MPFLLNAPESDLALSWLVTDWHRKSLGINDLHAAGLRGEGVTVVVLDTGIDGRTGAFDQRTIGCSHWSSAADVRDGLPENDSEAFDFIGHGTKVCGILVGDEAPVAPACSLISVSVADPIRGVDPLALAAALDAIGVLEPDVVSISLGSSEANSAVELAIDQLRSADVLVFAAADDRPSSIDLYPAAFQSVLGVMAHGIGGQLIPAELGELKVDVAAPGMFVRTNGKHGPTFMNGSSASVAIAAGVSALLLSAVGGKEERRRMRAEMPRLLLDGVSAIEGRPTPVRLDPLSAHRMATEWLGSNGGLG